MDSHPAAAATTGSISVRSAFVQPVDDRGKGMFTRFRKYGHAAIFKGNATSSIHHRMEATVPTGVCGDDLFLGIEIDPDMFQFIEMLNVPIPPDGVFNGTGCPRWQ